MKLRSLLFVPGDRPELFAKAAATGADALTFDLEDSVSADRKAAARGAIVSALQDAPRGILLLVRVNPLSSAYIDADLDLIAVGRPDGVVLPKAEGAETVEALVSLLATRVCAGIPILPIATETPAAIFALGSYPSVSRHRFGLTGVPKTGRWQSVRPRAARRTGASPRRMR